LGGVPGQYNYAGWPIDRPGAGLILPNRPPIQTASYTMNFKTYVDYQVAGGGLHIELAEADWTVKVWITSNGPAPPTQADYTTPNNWNWLTNTVTGPTVTYGNQLITWGMNVDDAKQLYSYTQ
jgi:hypothetical protein